MGSIFDEEKVLEKIRHYLPSQSPLKDFIHHNPLHAFQEMNFFDAIRQASGMFGYKISLNLNEFRTLFRKGKISAEILDMVLDKRAGEEGEKWKNTLLHKPFFTGNQPRVGKLRAAWKREYQFDLDSIVQPVLFRLAGSYLDQGIAIWNFPVNESGLLASVRELEKNSYVSVFRSKRVRSLLLETECGLCELLKILVGEKQEMFERYLFDQQFGHPGWSGMVSVLEAHPEALLEPKPVSLRDFIALELLLEIDALDREFGKGWQPLGEKLRTEPENLFDSVEETELSKALALWQEAFEWTYYDQVLAALAGQKRSQPEIPKRSFQAFFCIDDREGSLARYLGNVDANCETFSTPGHFGLEFYFKAAGGKFYSKLCPAPIHPRHLIKEFGVQHSSVRDIHFAKRTQTLGRGWLISQTIGFWSAFKLFLNIFKPTLGPATASSFQHMDRVSQLTIECANPPEIENGLQVGFSYEEMAIRVASLLQSIGLVGHFAPLVYVIGHGSSSTNNPHYAAYDCGACSGRPGSVNARVFCHMANHSEVRKRLAEMGIRIPDSTHFVGGLHDTTRDEIVFFDEGAMTEEQQELHAVNHEKFSQALRLNAKERSRRLDLVNTKMEPEKVHEKIKARSVSLFEPRPELNHATNAICIVGRRELTRNLFLDRRAFLNSYDFRVDPEGKSLLNILKAATPVCGGINLEYFFSRTDNYKLGAGTKLPHNVMGLFGVANGIDGDLRTGLPAQMIEVHDPVRLMIVVEQFPELVNNVLKESPEISEWFMNEWVRLAVLNPHTHEVSVLMNGRLVPYHPLQVNIRTIEDINPVIERNEGNIPVFYIAAK